MLTTLTLVTGGYSYMAISRMLTNNKLLKENTFKYESHMYQIKPVNIVDDGIFYRVYKKHKQYDPPMYVGSNNVKIPIGGGITKSYVKILDGYTFTSNNNYKYVNDLVFNPKTKFFNNSDDYNNFCNQHNLHIDEHNFFKIKVEYDDVKKNDEVYMLSRECENQIICEMIGKMSHDEFVKCVKDKDYYFTDFLIGFCFVILLWIVFGNYYETKTFI